MDQVPRGVLGNFLCRGVPKGSSLISFLKGYSLLKDAYARPLGGVDNLNLEGHTLAVLECYESFFEGKEALLLSNVQFKLLLALHDLGKPQAVAEGRFERQHDYTCCLIDWLCKHTELPTTTTHRMKTIIKGDPIGRCLNSKFHVPPAESHRIIKDMATKLGVTVSEYWPTLLIYYQCDAAGYKSLRRKVFLLNSSGRPVYSTDKCRFLFRDSEEAKRFDALEGLVTSV